MRNADDINPKSTPQTHAEKERNERTDQLAAMRATRIAKDKIIASSAAVAEGTPEARQLIIDAVQATEDAIDAYAAGVPIFERDFEWRTIKPKKFLGVTYGTQLIENPHMQWKEFRVRVLENGKDDGYTSARELTYPVADGFVITFDVVADWLRAEIVALLDTHGYQRTTYISTTPRADGSLMYTPMGYKLSYALPGRHV